MHGGMGGADGFSGGASAGQSTASASGATGGGRQMNWPTHLVITQDATSLHVNSDGTRRDVPLTSKGSEDPRDPTTGWYGSEFVVETGSAERMQVTQRYSLSTDQRQLSVRTDIATKRSKEPVTIWRVFDRVAPHAP